VWQGNDLFVQLTQKMNQLREALAADFVRAQAVMNANGLEGLFTLSAALVDLVAKLLSARKRARDWKQAEYCSALCSALTAASAALRVELCVKVQSPNQHEMVLPLMHDRQAFGRWSRLQLLRLTMTAQEELCQLLPTAMKQQQQQRQQAPHTTSQQEARPTLVLLGWYLLSWWATIDAEWYTATSVKDMAATEALAMQKPALELAVLLSQTLTADATPADINMLADVTSRWVLTVM
jgi:hypothetical protein